MYKQTPQDKFYRVSNLLDCLSEQEIKIMESKLYELYKKLINNIAIADTQRYSQEEIYLITFDRFIQKTFKILDEKYGQYLKTNNFIYPTR